MLFKSTDYLQLKYFTFALEGIFNCVIILSHITNFFAMLPFQPLQAPPAGAQD